MQATPGQDDDRSIEARFRKRYRLQSGVAEIIRIGLLPLTLLLRRPRERVPPRRILICNAGHIGDAILSTAVLRPLRRTYPNAEIGFLAGAINAPVLNGHPLIDRFHRLDHWAASRSGEPLPLKLFRHLGDARRMRRELRSVGYDMAIDLHAWFPNNTLLLAACGIPERIGCDRFGLSGFLTRHVPYDYRRRHEVDGMRDLLRTAGASDDDARAATPEAMPITEAGRREAAAIIPSGRFAVLHPTASTPVRDWPIDKWCELAQQLAAQGIVPVVTGRGVRDQANAAAITAAAPSAVSAVDRLSWQGLGALLTAAETVFCVETSIGHYARALGRPVVAIYGGMADPVRWAPLGAAIATAPQPCAPCFQKDGCATRACLTELAVDDVLQAASAPLDSKA